MRRPVSTTRPSVENEQHIDWTHYHPAVGANLKGSSQKLYRHGWLEYGRRCKSIQLAWKHQVCRDSAVNAVDSVVSPIKQSMLFSKKGGRIRLHRVEDPGPTVFLKYVKAFIRQFTVGAARRTMMVVLIIGGHEPYVTVDVL